MSEQVKRGFTVEALQKAIKQRWPSIGDAAVIEFSEVLFRSPYLPAAFTIDDSICFSDEIASEHALYLLCRYCFDVRPGHVS